MSGYISDSEDEGSILLSPSSISQEKICRALSLLPRADRDDIYSRLKKSRFSSLLTTRIFEDRENSSSVISLEGSENQLAEPWRQNSSCSSSNVENQGLKTSTFEENKREVDIEKRKQESENATNLQIFLHSSNQGCTSRRGLRKRNFSSTHPYLADQAQWLDLTSVEHLNEIYRENRSIEVIVKYLNQIYLRKKKSYPNEEKYKAKNFYSFLGKRSTANNNKSEVVESCQDTQGFSQPSENLENENLELNVSSYESESDESTYDISYTTRRSTIPNIIEDEENEEEEEQKSSSNNSNTSSNKSNTSSDEDVLVRVGGKFRKEKNVLRGALPESAKRLEIYKSSKKSRQQKKKKEMQYRKGLAVKKTSTGHKNNDDLKRDLINFVDDENYYQDDNIYHDNFNTHSKDDDLEITKVNIIDVMSTISDDYGSDGSNYSDVSLSYDNVNVLEFSPNNSREKTNDSIRSYNFQESKTLEEDECDVGTDDSGYSSVKEVDVINPLFANSRESLVSNRKKKYKINKNKPRSKEKMQQSTLGKNISSIEHKSKRKLHASRKNNTQRRSRLANEVFTLGRLHKKRIGDHLTKNKPNKKEKKIIDEPNDIIKTIKNPKDLFRSEYYFSRDPNQMTISFEAESAKKFIKKNHLQVSYSPIFSNLSLTSPFSRKDYEFPTGYILNSIDVDKISKLKLGQGYVFGKDSVTVVLVGTKYSFVLVDKVLSSDNSDKLLVHLSKLLHDWGKPLNVSLEKDIYHAIKGMLEWYLILQEPPSEKSWRSLKYILKDLGRIRNKDVARTKLVYYPYLLLLYYFFIIISERDTMRNLSNVLYSEFGKFCVNYWIIFLQFFEPDNSVEQLSDNNDVTPIFESIYLMHFLTKDEECGWWKYINDALLMLSDYGSNFDKFNLIFFLATIFPSSKKDWSCFYTIYENCKAEDNSKIHNHFLDIIYSLNQRYSWPLEEKILTLIYSTITSRKFSNFIDEWESPNLMEKITTRDNIPDSTFFGRFMHLLYSYVSSLPYGTNKKKLITKLLTSSHYHYEKDKSHFIMFLNRLNFILLLLQLSDVDLKNQLYDLIQHIRFSDDLKIFGEVIKGLKLYSQIVLEKGNNLPFESFLVMIETIIQSYMSLPGLSKLWNKLFTLVQNLFTQNLSLPKLMKNSIDFLSIIRKLDFKEFPDKVAQDICQSVLSALHNVISFKEMYGSSQSYDEVITDIKTKNLTLLHIHMGRVPLKSLQQEEKIEEIIELSIKIWVRCTSLSKEQNWNVLVLQQFPYIGNIQSREKFSLFFYNELFYFTNLNHCMDNVISALMSSLASFSTSKYLYLIINSLKRINSEITSFEKPYIFDSVTSFQVQNFKSSIVANIIFNISNSTHIPRSTKLIYLESFIRRLSVDNDIYYSSISYSDFCKSSVKTLQKHCRDLILSNETLRSLSSKLGIQQVESNEYKWLSLSLKERLVYVHTEFSAAIYFNKDYNSILDKLILPDNIELIYHLISIYTKAIIINQTDKWVLVSYLLNYILSKLSQFKVSISDVSFRKFLQSLIDLPYLKQKVKSQEYEFYQMKTLYFVFTIYEHAYLIYDGYKDKAFLIKIIENLEKESFDQHPDEAKYFLKLPFSPFRLYDIQQPGKEFRYVIQSRHSQDEIFNIQVNTEKKLEELKLVFKSMNESATECLEFNLD